MFKELLEITPMAKKYWHQILFLVSCFLIQAYCKSI